MNKQQPTKLKVNARPAQESDVPFMRQMLYTATIPERIPLEFRPSFEKAMSVKWINRYIDGWGRPEDNGIIAANEDGMPIGAAWFRRYTPEQMREIISQTDYPLPPHEIAVGVDAEHRDMGVGHLMLDELKISAAAQGVAQLCLSVSQNNPAAQHLYLSHGFVPVEANQHSQIMVAQTK